MTDCLEGGERSESTISRWIRVCVFNENETGFKRAAVLVFPMRKVQKPSHIHSADS